ncbi:tRNA nucleotidyltransferase (CCA-adding enzyme) [Lachnospiraceae bacterium NE2001]|nr:tRNA nucleotidyltransferase (CCA-adding enzyme) [Lachnospiraceae bacterium NE2001]
MKDIKIEMPQDVRLIIEKLNEAGFEAYAVGGCVRDSILQRKPNDWDITTSATPYEVKDIFRRTVDTGLKHGTVTVMLKNEGYEVTTFRIDGEYTDHRRPDGVTFTRELSEDLLRRDFTINAMAYNDESGVVDLYGGLGDLENGVIRCVGEPDDRFDEDALRIMRAVRFAAQLGFTIEEKTRKAAAKHAPELANVSAERIETELTKLLLSPYPEKIIDMYELGITREVLPEFDRMMETPQNSPFHKFDVGRHTVEVIKNVPATKVMRYAALLHDIGKPDCKTTDEGGVDHFKGHAVRSEEMVEPILRRLKMDNDTIRDVKKIVYWHDYGISGTTTKKSLRRMLSKMGAQYFDSFVAIRRADMAGQSDYLADWKAMVLEELIQSHDEIIAEGNALTLKDLAIGGADLKTLGIQPGPEMGRILNDLLDKVLEDPTLNTKEQLIQVVTSL